MAQAFSPWLFGLALDRWGAGALVLSASMGAIAWSALFLPMAARRAVGTGSSAAVR
jgi:hypothetical protein